MISVEWTTRKIFAGRVCAASYFASQDPFYKESFNKHMVESAARYKKLQLLLKSEPATKVPLTNLKDQILLNNKLRHLLVRSDLPGLDASTMFQNGRVMSFMTNRPAFQLMQLLRKDADSEAQNTLASISALQWTLVGGFAASLALSTFFAVCYSLSFSNRILKIVDNTVRLSRKEPLSPPLEGKDEVAELDRFLYKSAAEIRQLEQFKQELIGVVSHELKSPLSALSVFISGLENGIFGEFSSKKGLERIRRAGKNADRLMLLVTELLDLEKIEAGQLELNYAELDLAELIKSSTDSVKEFAEQANVSIDTKVTGGTSLRADHDRLIQVIVNLLSNAIKFSPLQGTVLVSASITDGIMQCRISDQGKGIPESFRQTIFEPFKQVDSQNSTEKKGTGIGLTISRSIIQQHGGEIGVDSVLGQGSTFWFKIPARSETGKQGDKQLPSLAANSEQTSALSFEKTGGKSQPGRFGVMKKGLVLISVPLIFQLGFVTSTAYLLYQIKGQVDREEKSKAIVDTLNRIAEKFGFAANYAMTYVASRDEKAKESWLEEKASTLALMEDVKKLGAGDSKEEQNIKQTEAWLIKGFAVVGKLINANETNIAELLYKSGFIEESRPLEEQQDSQDALLKQENEVGKKLAAQRESMIAQLYVVLGTGLAINILLTIGLSIYLMRALTNRLQHVMENTARLVKREELLPPQKGSDEIAYLDQTFYQAGKHLVELEAFKREIIAVVSHELRTPLMSVSSILEMLWEGALGDLTPKAKTRLSTARNETSRLIRLINNLLDIEKMEAGKFDLAITELPVTEIIDTSIASVSALAEAKHISIERLIQVDTLEADRDRIVQVLINLLSNAIKFSTNDSVVKVEAVPSGTDVEFSVFDHGRGIPQEMQEQIFQRFVQVEKKADTERGGTGLGLALSKCIVEQHGGQMGVESTPNEGSRFWFKVPATNKVSVLQAPPQLTNS